MRGSGGGERNDAVVRHPPIPAPPSPLVGGLGPCSALLPARVASVLQKVSSLAEHCKHLPHHTILLFHHSIHHPRASLVVLHCIRQYAPTSDAPSASSSAGAELLPPATGTAPLVLLLFFEPPAPVACAEPVATVDATGPKRMSATSQDDGVREPECGRGEGERKDGLTGHGGGVRRVVVRLDVRICHVLLEAGNYRLDREWRIMRLCIRQDVSCGNLDALLEEIMLEDNETSVTGSCVANNVFPVL